MYTPAQAEAISSLDQPLQIIACAGSGKTQVISQRIAAILALPAVKPRNIIAFTYTEKAAAELKERVLSIVEREIGDVTGLAEMFIGTMHGYCLDLMQRLVPEKFKFSVLTEITAQQGSRQLRDVVAQRMTAAEMVKAEARAQQWKPALGMASIARRNHVCIRDNFLDIHEWRRDGPGHLEVVTLSAFSRRRHPIALPILLLIGNPKSDRTAIGSA